MNERDKNILLEAILRETKNANFVQIGEEYNLTRQRVAQIVKKSIEIIKRSDIDDLKIYY